MAPLHALVALALAVGPQQPRVAITSPRGDEPVFGTVTVTADTGGCEPVAAVEFLLDGRPIGTVEAPPYAVTVDVGEGGAAHRFEVTARCASGGAAAASVVTPALHVDASLSVDLRQLYVTVTRARRRVLDLRPGDFTIVDRGQEQKLVTFARGDVPFTAVLLLDCSGSMGGPKLETALGGVRTFLAGMTPLDEASVVAFADHPLLVTPFLSSSAARGLDFSTLRAQGGTALTDHLYLALKLLEQRQGRRAVILLSDGEDLTSALRMDEVLLAERHSQAIIYWIRPPEETGRALDRSVVATHFSSWRSGPENAREFGLLSDAVAESGGRPIAAELPEDLASAFSEVLAELRDQYVLGFYPSALHHDGSWHAVEVRVARPGVKVRARGYLDF